ncbi:carboxylesterase family protein [Corynebacterium sp. TAE3-ERU12]|uniref:carboxylesterase family protein n=1 Tax=Corynebacterium sp. TAE3-ERU12 TaxID=2849491 RepID=UPI001C457460|nr:carboxylesterase family protein [Corynebacterium sp. TAE3-ERU12]MBV7295628.1 carboxylesterase family protein [Corynebacterium sp. TAE3-ERU12]
MGIEWLCPAGRIIGERAGSVVRARGIPYATADRYQPPQPIADSTARIDATAPAPVCPQQPQSEVSRLIAPTATPLPQDENCQRLSITAPQSGQDLPVLVWIHGGAYSSGGGDQDVFDPRRLVEEQNVIVVNITYRLGVFGFMNNPDRGIPANLGLLDIIAALGWVHRNIAGFGGDPDNVTIFGQSAGADAVVGLLAAEDTRGLFRRAIVQSAPLLFIHNRAAMQQAMRDAAGPPPADAPISEMLAAELRAIEAAQGLGPQQSMPFGLVYGEFPLPKEEDLHEVLRQRAPEVDLFIGRTTREASLFMNGVKEVVRLRRFSKTAYEALIRLWTLKVYGRIRMFTASWAAVGGHGYRYHLDWGAANNIFRSTHTCDLPLLFGDERTWRQSCLTTGCAWDTVHADGQELRRVWASFARTGRVEVGGAAHFLDATLFN